MDMDDGLLLPFRGLVVWDDGVVLWNNVVFGLHRWLYTSYIICSLFFVSKEEEMMGSRILVVACMYPIYIYVSYNRTKHIPRISSMETFQVDLLAAC